MLHLLLVSIQVMIPRMTLFDSTQELTSFKDQNNSKINLALEKILFYVIIAKGLHQMVLDV